MSEPSTESGGRKPVLVEVPANFADLPEDQQDRFAQDLADQLLGNLPPGQAPYRPEAEQPGSEQPPSSPGTPS